MKSKLIILLITMAFLSTGAKVFAAAGGTPPDCIAPYFIPTSCPVPYIAGQQGGYTADLNCQLVRITKPGTAEAGCCPNICVSADGEQVGSEEPVVFRNLEVFGTTIRVNPNNIGTMVNILFTTVLGFVSVYAIFRGIYVTGVKRPMAITADQIAELNKELTNLVLGVVISWGFIIIIQVVANFLGVGQLNNLDISGGESGGTVITIN